VAAAAGISPFVIAVDGFGGAGKSSLCRRLIELLPDCGTIQIDDFIVFPHEPNVFDHDWHGIEDKVLKRLKRDEKVVTKTYDWHTLGPVAQTQPVRQYMLIDGIGVLDPKYAVYFDFKIWMDCPFELSLERGKRRDKVDQGADHDELWDTVWGPGEKQYFERVRPDLLADVLFRTY